MPPRENTPPPSRDEPTYFTVVYPYPLHANMELQADRMQLALWIACCIGKDAILGIHHKPSSPNMVIIEVLRSFTDHDKLLGEHKWTEFLKNPSDEEKGRVSQIFYCHYKNGREVQKKGWKAIHVQESWFIRAGWTPNNAKVTYPYPPTHFCHVPPEDSTRERLCMNLPMARMPHVEPPPPPQPKSVPGSIAWTSQQAQPAPSAEAVKAAATNAWGKNRGRSPGVSNRNGNGNGSGKGKGKGNSSSSPNSGCSPAMGNNNAWNRGPPGINISLNTSIPARTNVNTSRPAAPAVPPGLPCPSRGRSPLSATSTGTGSSGSSGTSTPSTIIITCHNAMTLPPGLNNPPAADAWAGYGYQDSYNDDAVSKGKAKAKSDDYERDERNEDGASMCSADRVGWKIEAGADVCLGAGDGWEDYNEYEDAENDYALPPAAAVVIDTRFGANAKCAAGPSWAQPTVPAPALEPTHETQQPTNLWENHDQPKEESVKEDECLAHGNVCPRGICKQYAAQQRAKKASERASEREKNEREREAKREKRMEERGRGWRRKGEQKGDEKGNKIENGRKEGEKQDIEGKPEKDKEDEKRNSPARAEGGGESDSGQSTDDGDSDTEEDEGSSGKPNPKSKSKAKPAHLKSAQKKAADPPRSKPAHLLKKSASRPLASKSADSAAGAGAEADKSSGTRPARGRKANANVNGANNNGTATAIPLTPTISAAVGPRGDTFERVPTRVPNNDDAQSVVSSNGGWGNPSIGPWGDDNGNSNGSGNRHGNNNEGDGSAPMTTANTKRVAEVLVVDDDARSVVSSNGGWGPMPPMPWEVSVSQNETKTEKSAWKGQGDGGAPRGRAQRGRGFGGPPSPAFAHARGIGTQPNAAPYAPPAGKGRGKANGNGTGWAGNGASNGTRKPPVGGVGWATAPGGNSASNRYGIGGSGNNWKGKPVLRGVGGATGPSGNGANKSWADQVEDADDNKSETQSVAATSTTGGWGNPDPGPW